ncbi:HET-domain-containing protein [Apiospora saccharicola]|uniref:HET-domain-containing protein n=1 Tax=Apiospora saccharicola TaxID=335842 RepID=A0ABR1ULY9_9PEZI
MATKPPEMASSTSGSTRAVSTSPTALNCRRQLTPCFAGTSRRSSATFTYQTYHQANLSGRLPTKPMADPSSSLFPSVEFFSKKGKLLGDKQSLGELLQQVTRVPTRALNGATLSEFGEVERMS